MRAVIGILLMCIGLGAMAQEQVIAQGSDESVPKVELNLPEKPDTPFIQTYHTDKGELASLVTPEEGNQYSVVHVEQAYQTQYPQYREADVPNNRSTWVFFGW
jgi:hypothetical protein